MTSSYRLGDTKHFDLRIGKRHLKKDLFGRTEGIPVYSANVHSPFGYAENSNIDDFTQDYVLWGIDGDFAVNTIHKGTVFATTDHCGAIRIKNPHIVPEYLAYQLDLQGHIRGFDRGLRSSLTNMRRVSIDVPVDESGEIDVKAQLNVVRKYRSVRSIKAQLESEADALEELNVTLPDIEPKITFRLGELFDLSLPSNPSSLTKRFVHQNPGPIPVYSASGDEHTAGYGFMEDNLPGIRYFEDILTWNIDGSLFRAFYRRGRFSLSEKVIPLVLHDKYSDSVDYDYIRHIIDAKVIESGAAYQNKPGKGRIKKLELDIPAKDEGGCLVPDIERQRKLGAAYAAVQSAQTQVIDSLRYLVNRHVTI